MILSIIVPYKNSPELLRRLLGTITEREDVEVLVVDDHSSELERPLIENRRDVRILRSESGRRGAGGARNTGLEFALGEWVMFADADDVFTSDAFDILGRYFSNDPDVIYFKPTSRWEGTDVVADRHRAYAALVKEYENWGSDWIRYRFHVCWSKLIRRDLIDRYDITFDETRVANDLVFSLQVGLHAQKIEVVDEVIYCVTQSPSGNLSSLRSEECFDTRLERHLAYNQALSGHGLSFRRMAVLSILKKALTTLGPRKFLHVVRYCVHHDQPFVDHWHYIQMVWRRRLLKHRYR